MVLQILIRTTSPPSAILGVDGCEDIQKFQVFLKEIKVRLKFEVSAMKLMIL